VSAEYGAVHSEGEAQVVRIDDESPHATVYQQRS
jgi:hypothetical protein